MLSRALRQLHRWHTPVVQATRWASSAPSSAAAQLSIREAFVDIRNSLALVNQGERLKAAQAQVNQLSKELEVRSGCYTTEPWTDC